MNRLTAFYASLMVGCFVLSGIQSSRAQTADDILNKADAVYANAKTYQATYHWVEKHLDSNGIVTQTSAETVEVKAIGTTKFALQAVYEKPQGHKRHDEPPSSWQMVDDGKDHYNYLSGSSTYSKDIHDEWVSKAADNGTLDMIVPRVRSIQVFNTSPCPDYTLLAPTTIHGKPVYVVEVKGNRREASWSEHLVKVHGNWIRTFSSQAREDFDDLFYIDQTNFHLLQKKATSIRSDGIVMTRIVVTTQSITSEVLDAPIPENTFIFQIPKGVTAFDKVKAWEDRTHKGISAKELLSEAQRFSSISGESTSK